MKKIIIEEEKLSDLTYWDYLFSIKEDDFKKLKKETKHDILSSAYKKSPISIRHNKEFVLKAVEKSYFYLWDIDDEIKDLEFCTQYMKVSNHPSLTGMPTQYHNQLFKDIVIKNPWAIREIFHNKELASYSTKDALFNLVKENPKIYKSLLEYKFMYRYPSSEVDVWGYDLAEVAALKDPLLLFDMNKATARKVISKNIDIGLELFKTRRDVFGLLPLKYRSDKSFVNQNILNISEYKYIGKNLLHEKDIVLKIRYFYDLELPKEIIEDKEVAQHMLNMTSRVDSQIKDCANYTVVELVSELIRDNKNCRLYCSLHTELQKDIKIIISLLDVGSYSETIVDKNKSYWDPDRTKIIEKSVILLLPDDVKALLKNEYESTDGKLVSKVSDEEYLSFVKSYYLFKDLSVDLPNTELSSKKKLKI